MTKMNQSKPVQENDSEEMETSLEEDQFVKTCHAATISTKQASDADSGSEKDDKQVSTVAAVITEEPENKEAGGSGEAQPSAAFSRKSERIKKMKKKVEDEEDREETFGEDWFEKSFFVGLSASLGMDEEAVKKLWASVPMEKKNETEWKWKVLHLEELRYLLSKHEFEYEVASAIYNATS